MPDKLPHDYDLAIMRSDSEAVRMVVSSVSQLRDLYDKLDYPIQNEIEAWRLLDAIKQHLEIGPAAAGDLDEMDNFMRGRWSHFSCDGYCLRKSFPQLSDAERRALVEADPKPVTEDQWDWHRNDGDQSFGLKLDKLRENLGKDNETRLKCWDELSEAVHDAFVWLFEQRPYKEFRENEESWKRQQKLEELDEFLKGVIGYHRRRQHQKLGMVRTPAKKGFWGQVGKAIEDMVQEDKEHGVWVESATDYLDRPWMQTPWLTGYLLANMLDAEFANNPVYGQLRKPSSPWFSVTVIAGIVVSFLSGWNWVAWLGIAYLALVWPLYFITFYKLRQIERHIALIRTEVASLSYDGEELSRRLRRVEEKWPYVPSIAYSLLRLAPRRTTLT